MSGATHFKGKENVVNAYELNNVGPWAIFSGRDILFQSIDPDLTVSGDLLDTVLSKLIEGGAGGQFQLRIYDELTPGKKINNATPFNYSFKFQLLSDEEYQQSPGRGLGGHSINGVLERLSSIEKALQDREEQQEPEPENKLQATIGALLEKPELQQFLVQKVIGLVNGVWNYFTPKPRTTMTGMQTDTTTMNETQQTVQQLFQNLSPEEQAKFDQAVSVLLAGDPNIGTNLMKLANILRTDPAKYQLLTKMA